MTIRPLQALAVLGFAAAAAACSGGTTSTPAPAATATPAPAQTTVTLPQTAGTVTLAAAGGSTPALQIAAGAPAGVTLTALSSVTAPANAPAPSSLRRAPASITGAIPFLYVSFTVSASISASILAGETVTLASTLPTSATYYAEVDDITAAPATKLASFGPGTVANGTLTLSNASGAGGNGTSTLSAGHTYLLQFYYVAASATSTPSTAPTSTATAAPTATATSTSTATAAPSSTASATAIPAFAFGGSSASQPYVVAEGGSPVVLPTYQAVAMQVEFGVPSATSTMTVSDAKGTGDITPSGFPYYAPSSTVVIYFRVDSSAATTYPLTPGVQVWSTAFPAVTCSFYGYVNNSGNSYAWQSIVGSQTVSGSTVTFPATQLPPGETVAFQPAQPFYAAIACP